LLERPGRLGHQRLGVLRHDLRRFADLGARGLGRHINPQVYWEFGNEAADYETLAKWWAGAVEGTGVALYIGEAAYKATDGTFPDPAELGDHLDLTTQLEQVDGNVYFSAVSLRDDTTGFAEESGRAHA